MLGGGGGGVKKILSFLTSAHIFNSTVCIAHDLMTQLRVDEVTYDFLNRVRISQGPNRLMVELTKCQIKIRSESANA